MKEYFSLFAWSVFTASGCHFLMNNDNDKVQKVLYGLWICIGIINFFTKLMVVIRK